MALSPVAGSTAAALQAYRAAASGASPTGPAGPAAGFGDVLGRALEGVVDQGRQAETLSTQALQGQGNILDIVTAVSKAELSLQTTIAVRDKVVQAYQDVMRMSI